MVPVQFKKRLNLERSMIADPRSSLWETDVILVVQDTSDRYRRHLIDNEVLKCLFIHPEKESILVLNKVDQIKQKRRLFDLIANLTDGQLNGQKYDIHDNRDNVTIEQKLQEIYLNTAKKLDLKQIESSLQNEAHVELSNLVKELKACESALFDKLLEEQNRIDNNVNKTTTKAEAEVETSEVQTINNNNQVIENMKANSITLEKFLNKDDIVPYKTINDITAFQFKGFLS